MRKWILFILLFCSALLATEKFNFVILGDRAGSPDQEVFSIIISEIERLHPDFVINVGDISDNCEEKEWQLAQKELNRLTTPFYYIPGNNDIADMTSESLYVNKTGFQPFYSFDYENSHFIILDNSRYESWEEMPAEQMDWLKADLKTNKDKQLFVFMHKPFWYNNLADNKVDTIHQLFREYQVKAVFTGHWHEYVYQQWDGIDYYIIGSSGAWISDKTNEEFGNFYHYGYVTVFEDSYDLAVIKAGYNYPQNQTTMEEKLALDKFEEEIFVFRSAEQTGEQYKVIFDIHNLKMTPEQFIVKISHQSNWTVNQDSISLGFNDGDNKELILLFEQKENYYPLPEIKISYPLERKTIFYQKPINLARIVELSNKKTRVEADGRITKNEYAYSSKHFCDFDGSAAKTTDTQVYLDMDEENLYLAVRNFTKSDPVTEVRERDGEVYLDDCCGFLLTQGQQALIQVYINSVGTIWDLMSNLQSGAMDMNWNGDWQVVPVKEKEYWGWEVKVPLSSLSFNSSEDIYFNFRRIEKQSGRSALYTPAWSYDFSRYGRIEK